MRRVLFFMNPLLMARRNRRALVEGLARQLRAEGITVELQDTLSAHSAGEQARDAVEAGFDTLFVCGGDGTLFQVIQGVAGSEAAIGIIPFGTGNVLAQNLRLPRDPVRAFEMLRRAETVDVPLGRIVTKSPGHAQDRVWYFSIAAGMGVHAALMNLAPTGSGKRVGGRAAYFAGGFRLLLNHPIAPFELHMTLEDGSERSLRACELIAVRVGEINIWKPGGDLAAPNLKVAVVPETKRLGLAHAAYHALLTQKTSGSSQLPYPEYLTATQIVCRPILDHTYDSPLLVEADGEVIGLKRATITIAQRRLKLLWPR